MLATTSVGQLIAQGKKITGVASLEELLPDTGSFEVLDTTTVLLIVAPGAALTFTTRVTLAAPPRRIVPSEQVTFPVPPGGGAVTCPGWL